MRVLVTGATGFVGACLVHHLVHLGMDVHIFVREKSNIWRIEHLIKNVGVHYVDLRDGDSVQKIVQDIRPEVVFHLATYGGFSFQKDTKAILEANFNGTVNLLNACEQVGFNCFINTGSSSEYGIKLQAMKETDIPEPIGDYGVSKTAATLYCQSEARQKDLPIHTFRLFSPFGPWDDPQRLIPYVIKSLIRGGAPSLSTPQSVRDYVYIDDVINAYITVMEHVPQVGQIYNIGSGVQHTIGEVVQNIESILGTAVTAQWGKQQQQRLEPKAWVADISRARSQLKWQSQYTLQDGLAKTIRWIGENMDLYP